MNYPLKFELDRRQAVLNIGYGAGSSPTFGTVLVADGTAAAPSISFAADTDTGFYRPTANQIGLAVAGVSQLFFLSNGRIFGQDQANSVQLASTGFIALTASGTNQNITLTPSGTGVVSVGSIIAGTAFPNSQLDVNSTGVTLQATSIIDFKTGAGAQAARFQSNARFCLGTTTDSANGILQLAAHTTSAGGIGFGTDTTLYRYAPGGLVFGSAQTNTLFSFSNSSGNTGQVGFLGNNLQLLADVGSIILKSGNTTALTLDASQNATFAGNISTSGVLSTSSVSGFGITAFSSTWANLGAGTTARSSLRIGHGVAPTSPVDGDMWTTTAGAFIRINGVTKTFTLI
jgi:hypothetical protein